MPATPHAIGPLVRAAALRLGLRAAVGGGSVGLWIGTAGAAGLAVARIVGWVPWYVAVPGGVIALVVPALIGAGIGVWQHHLPRRERALLVDRVVGSDEALVTAIHQLEATGRTEALHALDTTPAKVRAALPIGAPRHAPWSLAAAALVAAALLALPRIHVSLPKGPVDDPIVAEGIELREALQKPEAIVLPEELRSQADDLAEALIDQELDAEEAAKRLEELQQAIEQFQQQLEPSTNLLEELEEAAKELDAPALDHLSDALAQADMGGAGQAAEALTEAMEQATPEQRQQAAQQLQEAGERMQQSSDPGVQELGEAMQQTGEAMEQGQGQEQDGGQGSTGGQENPLSPEEAQQLRDALERQKELGERLQQDRERLQQSQELSGAAEGAQERLGGQPQAGEGPSGDEDGEGEGQEAGVAQNGAGGAGSGAGSDGHTWEDEGEFDADSNEGLPVGGGDFEPDANQGEHIDDFEKFYAAARLDGAEPVLASEQGQIRDGRVDVLVTRLTGSDEEAYAPQMEIPASYQQEAVEAIETETIPPAYREAVKTYFDR